MTGEGPTTKESLASNMKGSSMFGRGLQTPADRLPSLKFPEAMVAFVQAAAKANDLPGWPLMSNKVQMQKCGKCSQEFYFPFNQRRHVRTTHRRPLNIDKEDLKTKKEQVAAYWDKLTPEEACDIVSVKNISILDLSAASVVRALSTHLQQPGLLSLPQSYVKSAHLLLDIVQNKPSRFPLSSKELLSVLDDASEKNILCGITSSSMQRCIFDGEPGKVGLETKNLVASLGYLVELSLVKAWMDGKDIEALRCQKVLVEEEEAAQRKRAKLQERKRQKKMRQKESKDKERKGCESSAGLETLKFDFLAEGNGTGQGDGDDSPTGTQSSPSSSGYSGHDSNHLETSQTDPNDFEVCIDGMVESKDNSLADEQEGLHGDPDCQENICWPGSAARLQSGTGLDDSVESRCSVGEDASHGDSLVVGGASGFSNGYSYDSKWQNGFYDQRGENGRSSVHFWSANGKSTGKVAGQGWRERRHTNFNECASYQRQQYMYDRGYYDYPYGSQKVSRKPFMSGHPASDLGGIATPRYGQYHEKYSSMRRASLHVGSVHAVWTRKASQHPSLELDQPDAYSKQDVHAGNGSIQASAETQPEHLLPENACIDDADLTRCAGADTCPANGGKPVVGVSHESCVSSTSVVSPPGTVAKTEGKEQANQEDFRASVDVSFQALSRPLSDMDVARSTAGEMNAALMIGSVKIPLGGTLSTLLDHISSTSNSQDIDTLVAVDPAVLPGRLDDYKVNGTLSRSENFMDAPILSKQSASSPQEAGFCPPNVLREACINVKSMVSEQSSCSNSSSIKSWKPGVTKVWRPVTVGTRSDSLASGSLSGAETVGQQGSDVSSNNDFVHREGCPAGDPDFASVSLIPHMIHSGKDTDSSLDRQNTQAEDCQEAIGYVCSDRSYSSSLECDSSREEFMDGACSVGEDVDLPSKEEFKSSPSFPKIASFLSQRWADAIKSNDAVDMMMLLRDSDEFFVKSISRCLSTPVSEDDISVHSLPDHTKTAI